MVSGPLADEHDLGVDRAIAGHGVRARLAQIAERARADFFIQLRQVGGALGRHSFRPCPLTRGVDRASPDRP